MTQPTFLQDQVRALLEQHGFNDLSEADKQAYLPQFLAEAERRIGQHVVPHLSEEAADTFIQMLENEKTTQEEWNSFWVGQVPQYEKVVEEALQSFAKDVTAAFAK